MLAGTLVCRNDIGRCRADLDRSNHL